MASSLLERAFREKDHCECNEQKAFLCKATSLKNHDPPVAESNSASRYKKAQRERSELGFDLDLYTLDYPLMKQRISNIISNIIFIKENPHSLEPI